MGCAISMIKYLIFIFNFVIALIGLAILAIGVWVHLELDNYEKVTDIISVPTIIFIVIGVIVFVIAFFGCCGAIQENHCMVVTYAMFLLTILIIQIGIGVWAFVVSKNVQTSDTTTEIETEYRKVFVNYWTDETDRTIVDTIQGGLSCCGVTSSSDFAGLGNSTIPWSCCGNEEGVACTSSSEIYSIGCVNRITNLLETSTKIIGGILIGVAGVELIGIIFALCLANSIRNENRRGYRV